MLANLQGSAVLELLAKTLTELGSVAGSAARWAGQEGRTVSAPLDPLPVESWAACSLGDDAPCDGTSAILVADVDAATEPDPEHWVRLLHDASVRECIATHGGIEVDAAGAPFAVEFSSARSAVLCAIGLQRIFAGRAADRPAEPLRVRMGLHAEEATADAPGDPGRT